MAKKKNVATEEVVEDIIATDYCDEMSTSFIDYAVLVDQGYRNKILQ